MHNEQIEMWRHKHSFNIEKKAIEKRTLIVVFITFVTMIVEIVFGWISNSMALFADGWHMGTHAFALGISLAAYIFARKYSKDHRFTFGTWKIEILGAYTSAVVLGIVGLIMVLTSLERIINPLAIQYDQALIVALLGLVINLICAIILNFKTDSHEHDHHHGEHPIAHSHPGDDDLNLKAAYLHVLADALTSILAIAALLGAKYFEWNWLDPFMGIVGAALIIRWSISLLKETTGILLELAHEKDATLMAAIQAQIESDGETKISDLHLWKVAQNKYACIVSLVTGNPCAVEEYKGRLDGIKELVHVTIEMNTCQ
ncbi:MAG: CDF family Co(II)/Ni(II) efflux transporter DmeF [Proteobacteria bacterium]|nr:CDF family Co(II)/Ni(II) efflux transporter DmeF [Pseudomonadota bacterium]